MKTLRPHGYQMRGVETLLATNGAGLFLSPGLGKTSTALMAFSVIKQTMRDARMLVIAPIQPMQTTWPAEVRKWEQFSHLRVSILHGPNKRAALEEDADIYLINPEGIRWLVEQELPTFTVLCCDESTKWKNGQSKRFKLLRHLLPNFTCRWILTGTPAPNGLMDLWAQSYIMDLGEGLGEYITHYRKRWFDNVGWMNIPKWVPRHNAMEEICDILAAHTLQLSAEDYLDMPDLLTIERTVQLPEPVRKRYETLEKDFIVELGDSEIIASSAAVLGNKLRQVANGFLYDEDRNSIGVHQEKGEALSDLMEELNGHPVLVLYEFEEDRDRIMASHPDAMCITGVKGKQLERIVELFNMGEIPMLIAHPGSTHGMNIQGASHHIIWYSLPWNLEHYKQAVYRLYRQGQASKIVYVYHIIAEGTVENRVSTVLREKDATQQKLFGELTRRQSVTS